MVLDWLFWNTRPGACDVEPPASSSGPCSTTVMSFQPRLASSSARLVPTMPAPMMTTRGDALIIRGSPGWCWATRFAISNAHHYMQHGGAAHRECQGFSALLRQLPSLFQWVQAGSGAARWMQKGGLRRCCGEGLLYVAPVARSQCEKLAE